MANDDWAVALMFVGFCIITTITGEDVAIT